MKITEYQTVLNDMRLPMVREARRWNVDTVTTPLDVARAARLIFGDAADEHVWVFCLNTKGRVTGAFEASHGTVNASIMNPREVFRTALLMDATRVVLCHNHPSGDVTPSGDDVTTTHRFVEAGKLLGVPVLDHIIVGDGYHSMAEHGEV